MVHFSVHDGKKNLKPCLSITIATMICNSALRTVVVMHANGEENMRLGCVCAKFGGSTHYIAFAVDINGCWIAIVQSLR